MPVLVNCRPFGSTVVAATVGIGQPVVVTVNVKGFPSPTGALEALVNTGMPHAGVDVAVAMTGEIGDPPGGDVTMPVAAELFG